MTMSTSVLAIIGGGRWGQVILSVIANMNSPFDRIVIISKANAIEVGDKISELKSISFLPIDILPTIDDLFGNFNVKAAIIVNSARQHFETAQLLINRGVHVLIEKPIVFSMQEMQTLIKDAALHNVCIIPGLNYRFCSYITNFAHEATKKGIPTQFLFKWCDAENEERYGRIKRHDTSISVVQDVMPHIWTILSIVFKYPKVDVHTCLQDNNSVATLTLSINNIVGKVLLQRNGIKRERYLSLQFDEDILELDFSVEPGVIVEGSKSISGDPLWDQRSGPLTRQLEYFFSAIANGMPTQDDLQCCLNSVACTEYALLNKLPFTQDSKCQ